MMFVNCDFTPSLPITTASLTTAGIEPTIFGMLAYCSTSGVASVNNWRGEYSYIRVHRPSKQSISKEINDAKHDI